MIHVDSMTVCLAALFNLAIWRVYEGTMPSLLLSFIAAYVLACLQSLVGAATVIDGMFFGFCIWLVFAWMDRSVCRLLSLTAMGAIIGT